MATKFRKGSRVLVIVDRADGGYDVVEATYEGALGSCYHQARKRDGGIIQCHANKITKAV